MRNTLNLLAFDIGASQGRGIVGAFEGAKPRQVLITRDQWTEILLRRADME